MYETWLDQIHVVKDILSEYGYVVYEFTDAEDSAILEERIIHINSRNHPETRFYTLLHELGHVEIYENQSEEFEAAHPVYVRVHDGRTYRSNAGKVSLIAEELEAWKIGRGIAQQYNLYIDNKKYNKHMTDALMGYINWVAH